MGLGVILLLNNLGYTSVGFWEIARLWPILLIAAGLEVLLGSRLNWASVIGTLLVLALISDALWFVARHSTTQTAAHYHELAYPRGGARTATIVLRPAVGSLTLDALSDSPSLAEAAIRTLPGEELVEEFVEGIRARLTLSRRSGPMGSYRVDDDAWNVSIGSDIPTDLTVDLGAGQVVLDLLDLQTELVKLDIGIGKAQVALPSGADSNIVVDGGVGALTVLVPPDAGARVTVDAGMVTRSMPPGFARSGDTYTSPNYSNADYQVDLTLSLGGGSIVVREISSAPAE